MTSAETLACPDLRGLADEIEEHLHRREPLDLTALGVSIDDPKDVQRALDDFEVMVTLHGRQARARLQLRERLSRSRREPDEGDFARAWAHERLTWSERDRRSLESVGIDPDDALGVERARTNEDVWKVVQARSHRPDGILDRMKAHLGERGKDLR